MKHQDRDQQEKLLQKESCMKRNVLTVPRMLELIQWLQKHKDRLLEEHPPYRCGQAKNWALLLPNLTCAQQHKSVSVCGAYGLAEDL